MNTTKARTLIFIALLFGVFAGMITWRWGNELHPAWFPPVTCPTVHCDCIPVQRW